MTYLEKYKMNHPGLSDDEYKHVMIRDCPIVKPGRVMTCPSASSLGVKPSIVTKCPACWNQEIPGTEPTNKTNNNEREDKNMNKNFTKADLKVGYIVKLKNSTEPHMVGMNNAGKMGFVDRNGEWVRLEHYDEFLADKLPRMGGDWSVMEVYGYSDFVCDAYKFTTDNRELLWKREEEKPKKTCDKCIHKVVCSHVGMCEHYMESEASK